MTREEMENIEKENAIKELKNLRINIGSSPDDLDNSPLYYALDWAIKQLEQTKWTPVSDPLNELPKDRMLYVTTRWEYVEILYWDMTEWSDESIARNTIAYMDYYEPQPYISCKK